MFVLMNRLGGAEGVGGLTNIEAVKLSVIAGVQTMKVS